MIAPARGLGGLASALPCDEPYKGFSEDRARLIDLLGNVAPNLRGLSERDAGIKHEEGCRPKLGIRPPGERLHRKWPIIGREPFLKFPPEPIPIPPEEWNSISGSAVTVGRLSYDVVSRVQRKELFFSELGACRVCAALLALHVMTPAPHEIAKAKLTDLLGFYSEVPKGGKQGEIS